MPDSRWCEVLATLALALSALGTGCRGDAAGGERRGESATASAPVVPAPTVAPSASAAPPVAPPASAAGGDGDCGGAPSPGAPLPHPQERKLATEQKGHYRFELKYPALQTDDEKLTPKLNQRLLEQLTAIQKRFVKDAEGEVPNPDPENARWFEGKCELAYQSRAFVSVQCDTMEGPGAHPNLDKFAVNLQVCPAIRVLTLSDVCGALLPCRKKIVDLINEDFRTGQKKETGIQFRVGPSDGEPDMEHPVATLKAFGITPSGLRFFLFDELPHVLQAFAIVDIPAAKMRPVLRDDVARRLWGL